MRFGLTLATLLATAALAVGPAMQATAKNNKTGFPGRGAKTEFPGRGAKTEFPGLGQSSGERPIGAAPEPAAWLAFAAGAGALAWALRRRRNR